MSKIESGVNAPKRMGYLRRHMVSTFLVGSSFAVGIPSGNVLLDTVSKTPTDEYVQGNIAKDDAQLLNDIQNQNVEGFADVKERYEQKAQELISTPEYKSSKSNEKRATRAALALAASCVLFVSGMSVLGRETARQRESKFR